MTDWSPVQRVWPNHFDAYQYNMFPGYQQVLPDAVPNNLPVPQHIEEHPNLPVSQSLPMQQSLPPSPNMIPQHYLIEPPNVSMSQNLPMQDGYPMMQNLNVQQGHPMTQYVPCHSAVVSQSWTLSQNVMTPMSAFRQECLIDPASVPLPDDIPLPQNVPLPEDVCMPQYIEQASEYQMPSTSELTMLLSSPPTLPTTSMPPPHAMQAARRPDNPRVLRNKAEKQRRDKLNRSIADLASLVPPVVAASRKIDKTGVLRLTAHYLRAHEYVFGNSLAIERQQFTPSSLRAVMGLFNGFLLTVTYRGIFVVVSENVQEYLGYTELELLGHNVITITHPDDQETLMRHLMPRRDLLGTNGELLVPEDADGIMKVTEALGREKRKFMVRFKKLGQRSEPEQYVRCHVEGSFRKSDKACTGSNRCCHMVRRSRCKLENHCRSGNDVVFIGVVRPEVETFVTEIGLESCRMEYRTRHSIDGEIIQCEQRIALVTGYMIHEVQGVNAMNFMHKDDVHWVIVALRDMYDQHRLYGESCYRLMTKNGDFIYMKTRGRLDVDKDSRVVTSFVCTNTVVDEAEGKYLIKMMKKKFNVKTKKEGELLKLVEKEEGDKEELPVEDPRQLEKVILHLVTNLPSQGEGSGANKPADSCASTSRGLAIIPPKKERIVSAIEKIYNVIKTFPKETRQEDNDAAVSSVEMQQAETLSAPSTSQSAVTAVELCSYGSSSSNGSQEDLHMQKQFEDSLQIPTTSVFVDPVYTDFDTLTQPLEPTEYNFITPLLVDENCSGNIFLPEANQSAVELKYEVLQGPEVKENVVSSQTCQSQFLGVPKANKSLKRPNECAERTSIKKKLSSLNNSSDDESADDDFSCLEALFDEEMLDKQIESAINALEQSIDPTFPDLLVSNKVQEILQNIEDNQNAEENAEGENV